MFFEDIRSECELMRVAADRLSIRWYLGYDLHEPLPDHSSLTKIRERYGLGIFRSFFEKIGQMCFEAGLVRGEELFFDSSKVKRQTRTSTASPGGSWWRRTWAGCSKGPRPPKEVVYVCPAGEPL